MAPSLTSLCSKRQLLREAFLATSTWSVALYPPLFFIVLSTAQHYIIYLTSDCMSPGLEC